MDWDGYWNGYFGKGVQNADLETYFVFDDNEDREYLLRYNYRPDARRYRRAEDSACRCGPADSSGRRSSPKT